MSLEHRLTQWVSAGLVSAEQALAIRAYERSGHRPTLLYAVAGLGGLAIALGLLSIVAANWDEIPGRVKIAVDMVMVAGLGYGVWHWERRGPAWAFETAVVVLYGLVLASIALIGQVYQLGGKTHEALLAWSVLTALLMSRARSGLAAMVWLLGLQVTWATWSAWIAEAWRAEAFALATIYWPPLLCVLLGGWSRIQRVRPALAMTLRALGWSEVVLCATLGTFAFYADTSREAWSGAYAPALVSVLLTGAALATVRGLPARLLLVGCLLLAHVPMLGLTGDLELVAALSFVALWLLVAWAAHHARDARLLNLATAVVGTRILAIYLEVFGSLLDTGLGLVSGGLLTLGLVWLWTRKRRQFERELGDAAEEDA